ncbi:hypothetical protein PWR05_35935 [Paraburkholderia sp. A2RI-6]|uniref:hypothetical protein n=1 Tax=Paraburkholderia sp. A2RI-6 TaxID=3028371 RepID=UPI003B7A0EF3
MTDDGIKAALLALTAKTKSGQLRELLPLIEAKVAAGVRHEDILAALGQHGFTMSMAAYKTTLYRIRKQRTGAPHPGVPASPDAPAAPIAEPQATGSAPAEADPAQPGETVTSAVLGAMDHKERENKFSKYGPNPMGLTKRLSQKKES